MYHYNGTVLVIYPEKTLYTTDIQNIQHVVDLTLVAESASELQAMVHAHDNQCYQDKNSDHQQGLGGPGSNYSEGEPIRNRGVFPFLGSQVGKNARK